MLQRRIGREEALDETGIFRIGAGELSGRRRTVGFRIAAVERQPLIELVRRAGHGIEALVGVRTRELVLLAVWDLALIVELETSVVVTAAHR